MSTVSLPAETTSDAPLRVWHVVGPMELGGTEVMVMEMLRHKAPSTAISFLVHQRRDHLEGSAAFDPEILARGCRLMRIITPAQSGLRAYFRDFAALLRNHGRPDVIHIHLNARSGIVVLAARLQGIRRIIVHSHAALTFRGTIAYRLLAQAELQASKVLCAAFATDYWGCSREAIDSLFARFPRRGRPRVVIRNAINIESFIEVAPDAVASARAELSGGRSGLLVGTVGRVVRHKHAAHLVEILAVLRDRGVSATLAIVGREVDPVYCDEIRTRAAELGLSDSIRFVGQRSDIPAVMAALDVFVSPALREGFGLVALEAQAAGTPTVVSTGFPRDIDMQLGIVQIISDKDAGIWADAVLLAAQLKCPPSEKISDAIKTMGYSASENTRRIERAWRDPSFIPGVKA